jgi:hypothetical protein
MDPTQEVIQKFGTYDFDRLVENEQDDVLRICPVKPELRAIAAMIQELIKQNKLHIMDKESGVAFPASVVIGFDENGLLIANER